MLNHPVSASRFFSRRSISAGFALAAIASVTPLSLVQAQPADQPSLSKTHAMAHKVTPKGHSKLVAKSAPKATAIDVVKKPATAAPQSSDRDNLKVVHLEYAQAAALAKVLRTSLVGRPVSIVEDTRTNSILLHGPESLIEQAERAIAELDGGVQPAGAHISTEMRIFHLEYAQAADMAEELRSAMGAHGGLNITVDRRTNTLLVNATPDRQIEVSGLLRTLDVHVQDQLQPTTWVLPLKYGRASEVARQLQSFQADKPHFRVWIDEDRNTLIVVSALADEQILRELVSRLDIHKS